MIIATPVVEGRIAPLFDVAKNLLVIEYQRTREIRRRGIRLDQSVVIGRLRVLSRNRIDILICEAISAALESLVLAEGILVIHHMCGPVDAILEAFVAGSLVASDFVMPGCGRPRQQGLDNSTCLQTK